LTLQELRLLLELLLWWWLLRLLLEWLWIAGLLRTLVLRLIALLALRLLLSQVAVVHPYGQGARAEWTRGERGLSDKDT
jgi:hypothetical protein